MVDWGGLENRCGVTATVGSNPTPSAVFGLEDMVSDKRTQTEALWASRDYRTVSRQCYHDRLSAFSMPIAECGSCYANKANSRRLGQVLRAAAPIKARWSPILDAFQRP